MTHSAQLDEVVTDWLERKPIAIDEHADPHTGWFSLTFRQHEDLPILLGAIFGDFVNNLESALDILVSDLVRAKGGTPSTGNYFPIVTRPGRWQAARLDKLKGVPDEWASRIQARQPFHSSAPQLHPLSLLHAANRINKHTVISPTVLGGLEWQPTFVLNRPTEYGDRLEHDQKVEPSPAPTVFVDGDVMARDRVHSVRGDLRILRVQRPIPVKVGVGFDLGIPDVVGRQFPDLLAFVVGVVEEFEQVLSE